MPKSMVSNSFVLFAQDSRPHFLTFKLVCTGYGLEKKKTLLSFIPYIWQLSIIMLSFALFKTIFHLACDNTF